MCSIVANLSANFWSDSEFAGRLGIKLASDWQILSLLKSADARSGLQTEHPIDPPAVVPFVLQSLLHLYYIVWMRDRWHFFAEAGSRRERRRAWPGDPRPQHYEDNPSARRFAG